jgi:hypothetical protein
MIIIIDTIIIILLICCCCCCFCIISGGGGYYYTTTQSVITPSNNTSEPTSNNNRPTTTSIPTTTTSIPTTTTMAPTTTTKAPIPNNWIFKYKGNGIVYGNTSVPTKEALSDGVWNRQDSVWGSLHDIGNYIEADFGNVKTVNSIIVGPIDVSYGGWGWDYLNGATLQYSTDGNNWINITDSINQTNTSLMTISYLVNISARYVRIIYLDNRLWYLGVGTFYFT